MVEAKKKKSISLEELANALSPDKIAEEIESPNRLIHHKYKLEKLKISNYEQFREALINYMKHHHRERYRTELPDHRAFTMAQKILETRFAEQGQHGGGFERAYKEARKGKLDDVIRTLADGVIAEEKEDYITDTFQRIDPYDFDKHVQLAGKYLEKYKTLLTPEMQTKKPEELAKNWQGLIQHHVAVTAQAKEALKKYEPEEKPPVKHKKPDYTGAPAHQ